MSRRLVGVASGVAAAFSLAACADAPLAPAVSPTPVRLAVNYAVGEVIPPRLLEMIEVGAIPGATYSYGGDINEFGQVAGGISRYNAHRQMFVWTPGTGLREFAPLPGGNSSTASAINDSGVVAGLSAAFGTSSLAVIWKKDGRAVEIGNLGVRWIQGTDLNAAGQVVGYGEKPNAGGWYGFLWSESTGITGLFSMLNVSHSQAEAINEKGEIVGFGYPMGAFYYSAAEGIRALKHPVVQGWSSGARAHDINNSGQVTGVFYSPAARQSRAFLYERGEPVRDIGTLPGGVASVGRGVNELGQVAGAATMANETTRAFLYTPGFGMLDLGTLPGAYASHAEAINDRGEITGWSYNAQGFLSAVVWRTSPPTRIVRIDVMPGKPHTRIALPAEGPKELDVAVFSTAAMDARLIDPATVRLGRTLVARTDDGAAMTAVADVDGDGLEDLVLSFPRGDLVANGDLHEETAALTLTGRLTGREHITGSEDVTIVGVGSRK